MAQPAASPPARITIVGLGPGDPAHLTLAVRDALAAAPAIWVRTRNHPSLQAIPAGKSVYSCDDLYEAHETFEEVYAAIAARIVAEAGAHRQPLVYAVPGDPMVGETSVGAIRQLAAEEGIVVTVLPAVSFIEPTLATLGWDALDGLQLADATTLGAQHYPSLDPGRPALIAQVYSQLVASELKLTLLGQYPPEHPVILVGGASTDQLRTRVLPLAEVDHRPEDLGDLTSLALPALARPGSLLDLADVVARLRAPDGCPWDIEQTHLTLRPFVLEETYEVLEALDAEDSGALGEELGDLLLQVVLHSQIAAEEGEFTLAEVVAGITEKIIRRHPHVFGDVRADTAAEVRANWEVLKRQEREAKKAESGSANGSSAGADAADDPFAGIPGALPALARAQAVQRRAARIRRKQAEHPGAGAADDEPDVRAVLGALVAAVAEGSLNQAESASDKADSATSGDEIDRPIDGLTVDSLQPRLDAESERSRQIGEALWAVVALARAWDVDAETALRERANRLIAGRRSAA